MPAWSLPSPPSLTTLTRPAYQVSRSTPKSAAAAAAPRVASAGTLDEDSFELNLDLSRLSIPAVADERVKPWHINLGRDTVRSPASRPFRLTRSHTFTEGGEVMKHISMGMLKLA